MAFTEVVARFAQRHQAELAIGYLDDAGVEAILAVDDAGGNLGVALEFDARIVVRAEDAPRAREVLRDAGVLDE